MTKRAVLYARVSGDDRKNATSGIDNQVKDCQKYAQDRDYEIVGVFSEEPDKPTSGADWLPEIEKILALAEQGAFDVLVVREIDRLARNRFKQLSIELHLEELGLAIEYVIGQYEDSDEGRLFKGMVSEFAEYERNKIRRRLHGGIYNHVRAGNIKTGGCATPYGYDLSEVGGRRMLVVNEFEAEIVQLMFQLRAVKGYAFPAICKYLDEHEIPKPMKGKAHKANTDKEKNLGWSRGTVAGILANEVYVGRWYYRKTKRVKNPKTKKTKHIPRPKSEWILVNVPSIITDELFQAAQKQGKRNKREKGKQHRHHYTIGGMVKCGRCGKSMSGITTTPNARNKQPTSYYVCNARLHKKNYGYSCDNPYVRAERIEACIWEYVKTILLDPERLKVELENYQAMQSAEVQPFLNLIESSQKKLAELQEEKERLIKAYAAGVLSLDELATQKTDLEKQIKDVTKTIAELQSEVEPNLLSPQDIATIESYEVQIREGANLSDDDPQLQRQIFKHLHMEVVIDEQEGLQQADVRCVLGQFRLLPNNETGSCINRNNVPLAPGVPHVYRVLLPPPLSRTILDRRCGWC